MTGSVGRIEATLKYDEERQAWRWWVGIIDGTAVAAYDTGLTWTRRRAQRQMTAVAEMFQRRINTDTRPPERWIYENGTLREVPRD